MPFAGTEEAQICVKYLTPKPNSTKIPVWTYGEFRLAQLFWSDIPEEVDAFLKGCIGMKSGCRQARK